MASLTNERAFEESIEQSLIANGGYEKGDSAKFDRALALDQDVLFRFIKVTQKDTWAKGTVPKKGQGRLILKRKLYGHTRLSINHVASVNVRGRWH